MGWNDHVDFELSEKLQELIDNEVLVKGTPAYGIACHVMDFGTKFLSDRQRYVYDTIIVPVLTAAEPRRFGLDE